MRGYDKRSRAAGQGRPATVGWSELLEEVREARSGRVGRHGMSVENLR